MTRASTAPKPTDEEILGVIANRMPVGVMTYVVRNVLAMTPFRKGDPHKAAYRNLDTAFIRRRLIAMEKAGKVQRVSSIYATQICWGLAA